MNGVVLFLIIFIGVGVYLLINYLIANMFYEAAVAKGFSEEKYFWTCFLLGMVGYLLVIALPDRCGRGANVPNQQMYNTTNQQTTVNDNDIPYI